MVSTTRTLQAQTTTVAVGDHDTGARSVGTDRSPDSRSLCVRTKPPQTRANELGVPLKVPPHEEPWVDCLVPAIELESGGSWAQIEHLLSIHVVGKTPDGKSRVVAVASSRVQILRDLDLPFLLDYEPLDVSEPTKAEVDVYGRAGARQKSRRRYVEKAVAGVASSQHQGLGWYYLDNTQNQSLLLPIEWEILIRDVEAALPGVRSHFYNLCCFLALHLPDDLDVETSRELINRTDESWMKQIKRSMMAWPTENATMGLHKVSLIRALFESAGGDALQHRFDDTRSANDNLAILGDLFGVELTEPVSFGRCRTSDARQKAPCKTMDLLEHTAFKCGKQSVVELQYHVAGYLPVWFFGAEYEGLPADLINDLPRKAVTRAQTLRSHAYCNMPFLRNLENSLPLFIFYWANMDPGSVPLRRWVASGEGEQLYRQLTATLCESQVTDQIALCLVALISYDLVLGSANEDLGPIHDSYLHDFALHMEGCELENRRGMWEQMICSFRRVRTCHDIANNWLDTACHAQSSHGLDSLSEWYWEHRSEGTHEFALEKVRGYLDKMRNSLGRCGRFGEEDGRDLGEKTGEDSEEKMEGEYVMV